MPRSIQFAWLTALIVLLPGVASAEWQIRPFGGLTFGGSTTFVDLDDAVGSPKLTLGANVSWLGEVFGIEADLGHTPGSFQSGRGLILNSHTTALTGNVVVALPRSMAQYTLRPYFVGGLGLMHVNFEDYFELLTVARNLTTLDLGGGATGFLSDTIGVNWDVRYFRTVWPPPAISGVSLGPEKVSFWRATMGLTIRP